MKNTVLGFRTFKMYQISRIFGKNLHIPNISRRWASLKQHNKPSY